jgi:kinesin family member 6/9
MDDYFAGNATTEDGEIIISEAEYLEITRVKGLKNVYKMGYEELTAIKVEVQYCQRLVEQCRQKLIQGMFTLYRGHFNHMIV